MTEDAIQWIPAAQALTTVADRFAAGVGFDDRDAPQEAAKAILERVSAGTLRAAPKGFLLNYDGPERPLQDWFHLRQVEPDGRGSGEDAVLDEHSGACCIPSNFWRMFANRAAASHADWASGDFYLNDFLDASGSWSGVARDVHFDQEELPGRRFAEAHTIPARNRARGSVQPKNKGGPPTKYDWPRAIAHLVAVANTPDGLDPNGRKREVNITYVAGLLEEWFETQGLGTPGRSSLHEFAGMVVNAIRELGSANE